MSTSWNTKTAIEQIESCNFECEAGPLKNNTAWAWLKSASLDPAVNTYDERDALLREAARILELYAAVPLPPSFRLCAARIRKALGETA